MKQISANRTFKNFLFLFSGTFISRIFGFIREIVTAAYFGASAIMDVFVVALSVPTLFRQILGEDIVEKAFMPPFKSMLVKEGGKKASLLLSTMLNMMFLVMVLITFILYLFTPVLVSLLAPGLKGELYQLAVQMTYVVLPFLIIIGLAAFAGGVLNFFELNMPYSFAPLTLSIGSILSIILFESTIGPYSLPVGFLIGGLAQLFVQIPFLYSQKIKDEKVKISLIINLKQKGIKKVAKESGFVTLQALISKTNEIVDRILASFLISGSISALWFSQRLIQLPNAIIGLAISRALAPGLAELRANGHSKGFKEGVLRGIRYNALLLLPVTSYLIIFALPIVKIVYERGDFSSDHTQLTVLPFIMYSVGLIGMTLFSLFSRIYAVMEQNKVTVKVLILSLIIKLILSFGLVKTTLKHGGLALASSLAFFFSAFMMFYILKQKLAKLDTPVLFSEISNPLLKISINTVITALVMIFIKITFSSWSGTFVGCCILLVLGGGSGGLVYLIMSFLLPVEETKSLKNLIKGSK